MDHQPTHISHSCVVDTLKDSEMGSSFLTREFIQESSKYDKIKCLLTRMRIFSTAVGVILHNRDERKVEMPPPDVFLIANSLATWLLS